MSRVRALAAACVAVACGGAGLALGLGLGTRGRATGPAPSRGREAAETSVTQTGLATALVSVTTVHGGRHTASGFLAWCEGRRGYVLTTAQAVKDEAQIRVELGSGTPRAQSFVAELVARDEDLYDTAVLRVEGDALPPPVDLRRVALPKLGSSIHVLGAPAGDLTTAATTPGTVSRVGLQQGRAFLIEAELWRGSAGSPVLDDRGALLGLISVQGPRGVVVSRVTESIFHGNPLDHSFSGPVARPASEPILCESVVGLVDPLERIDAVLVLVARRPADRLGEPVYSAAGQPLESSMREFSLRREGLLHARAEFLLEHPGSEGYVGQVKVVRTDGSFRLAPPQTLVPPGEGSVAKPAVY